MTMFDDRELDRLSWLAKQPADAEGALSWQDRVEAGARVLCDRCGVDPDRPVGRNRVEWQTEAAWAVRVILAAFPDLIGENGTMTLVSRST